jgi:hypothetical protein
MPLIVAALVLGAIEVARIIPGLKAEWGGYAMSLLLAGTAVAALVAHPELEPRCTESNEVKSAPCIEELSLIKAALHIRDSLPMTAVVMTSRPASIHYFSERNTLTLSEVKAGGDSLMISEGVPRDELYVLLSHLLQEETVYTAPSLLRNCLLFSLTKKFEPSTLLLRYHERPDSSSASCEALQNFMQTIPPGGQ